MKRFLREKIIEPILKKMAYKMLKKHKPEIIAITGSVGKTSTKDAISLVLKNKDILSAPRSYNTKIGGPLTIFNQDVPTKVTSVFGWFKVIFSSFFKLIFRKKYPEILIMELGIDKPGEMAYYLSFIKPKVGVVTAISHAHLALLKNLKKVAKEKSLLIQALPEDSFAILNFDDKLVREMASQTKAKVMSYGFSKGVHLRASQVKYDTSGLSFKLHFKKKTIEVKNLQVLGEHFIYSLLPAIACGLIYRIPLFKIIKNIKNFKPPKGRMNLIAGLNHSFILDDSYNANPSSMIAALNFLTNFKGRKIAALGTMNELGSYEEEGHRLVGKKAAEVANILVTVGRPAQKYLTSESTSSGLSSDKIFCFKNSLEAGKFLKKRIKPKDIILVKGSQNNVRMEWLIELIMAEPEKAKDLLIRQGPEWKKPKELIKEVI